MSIGGMIALIIGGVVLAAALAVASLPLLLRCCCARRLPGFVVGFFHPYSNAGGGGERVLWMAVKAMEKVQKENLTCLIYSGDSVSKEAMLKRAKDRFSIDISANKLNLQVVRLNKRHLVEAERYPRFTMLGQSLGSLVLGWEALTKATPSVFLDTAGYAFIYPLARLFGSRVGCYTHYPTITVEMLDKVRERRPDYNNSSNVSGSVSATTVKVLYYRCFSLLYSFVGSFANAVMVNSTWTKNHIDSLWGKKRNATVVFPPCNTVNLKSLSYLAHEERSCIDSIQTKSRTIVSVGQFRPEKDHALQIRAVAELLKLGKKYGDITLKIIGACRGEEDEGRVQKLKQLVLELGVEKNVEFWVNIPFSELQRSLAFAACGIHTMWNEHFGIGIVEMMAAGAIPIAHNSGGPKSDIVVKTSGGINTGFLASTPEEYAQCLKKLFDGYGPEGEPIAEVRKAGKGSVDRFSDEQFVEDFLAVANALFK